MKFTPKKWFKLVNIFLLVKFFCLYSSIEEVIHSTGETDNLIKETVMVRSQLPSMQCAFKCIY
jgi:hypothetical protein